MPKRGSYMLDIPRDAIGIKITCPTCGRHPVESATKVWWVTGFILAFRISSQTIIGCRFCIRKILLLRVVKSLFTGWWSPRSIIINPISILYNLINALIPHKRPNKLLTKTLDEIGLPYTFLHRGELFNNS